MNERDKELLIESKFPLYELYAREMEKFAALIRADEREALEKIDWTALMREECLVTWADAQELGDRVLAAIRAREKND
jgi:hypothetical protein